MESRPEGVGPSLGWAWRMEGFSRQQANWCVVLEPGLTGFHR